MSRFAVLLPVLSAVFLAFVAGAFVTLYNVGPAGFFRSAQEGIDAVYDSTFNYREPARTDLYAPERWPETGVTLYDDGAAQAGYTLYLSPPGSRALLIDMHGAVVHEWELPFSEIWDDAAAVKAPRGDEYVYWRWAKLMPNGDLYIQASAAGATPWGYGLFKLDKNSELQWKYLEQVHHDFTVMPDGRVVTLTHEFRHHPLDRRPDLKVPAIDDFLVVLSPEGEELTKISLLDALTNTRFMPMIDHMPPWAAGDPLHTNAAKPIDAAQAEVLPMAEAGQVLVSFRNIDALAVVDLETEEVTWALRGSWVRQHDPDILPDGRILLFDNLGDYVPGGRSRLIEVDPETSAIEWTYRGTEQAPFESDIRGGQQRLANGNTLVVESMSGRLFEVTRDGRIVWEFLNPHRLPSPWEEGRRITGVIPFAERVTETEVNFEFANPAAAPPQ